MKRFPAKRFFALVTKAEKILDDYLNSMDDSDLTSAESANLEYALTSLRDGVMDAVELHYPRDTEVE